MRDLIQVLFTSALGERWAGGRQQAINYLHIIYNARKFEHYTKHGPTCPCKEQQGFDKLFSGMINRVQHP